LKLLFLKLLLLSDELFGFLSCFHSSLSHFFEFLRLLTTA